MARDLQIVFDAHDPAALARFWAEALGYILQPPPPDFGSWEDWAASVGIPEERWNDARAIEDPDGARPRIFIQRVPEPKAAKNRLHLDVKVTAGPGEPVERRRSVVDTEVRRLEVAGAAVLRTVDERGEYWVVMQDPEGNEFCVV